MALEILDRIGTEGNREQPLPFAKPSRSARPLKIDAILKGFSDSMVALCICDAQDRILYLNAAFREAFCPEYDGAPTRFMTVMAVSIAAKTGIKLDSMDLASFVSTIETRRRELSGSTSFATDTVDGRWWWVTDTRLEDGGILAVCQDISALKREEFKLRDAHASALEEAQTDDLTGAPNRRHGLRRAETLFAEAQSSGRGLAVAVMDIDHFKHINDRFGHEAGDRALVHFAHHVMRSIPPSDQFSRIGGDEFLLVSSAVDPSAFDHRLSALLAAMPPVGMRGMPEGLKLSLSVGVAALTPKDNWARLMRRADAALYEAKAAGRDRVTIAV